VIDEASMMDITLFARHIDDHPSESLLILIGDRHQLASVEAGSAMADICSAFSPNNFTREFADLVNTVICEQYNNISASSPAKFVSPLVELQFSYRFEDEKPIGRVSREINQGAPEKALRELTSAQSEDDYCKLSAHPGDAAIARIILDGYGSHFKAQTPEDALQQLEKFMVLTALNEGRFGREGINQLVFTAYGAVPPIHPIKITENSSQHRLFNGDMGVIMKTTDRDGKVREMAWFSAAPDGDDEVSGNGNRVRSFLVSTLPAYVDAFAITIHNSQGSEFDKVVIILPEKDTPLLTRELLYTAITRAKTRADIFGKEEILKNAVKRKTDRHSGLADRLAALEIQI
jgi:exodeoxyribonuclease V alpha subunit